MHSRNLAVVIVMWLPFIVSSRKWILKQGELKEVFFVRYINHVQTLWIGFTSIRKEDILLVSLLNNVIFYLRFGAKCIRNVWTWSYTVNSRSFNSEETTKRVFSNQKRILFNEWRYERGFSIGLLWRVRQNSLMFDIS